MKKIDSIALAFAELNQQIIDDIKRRGYSHSDAETLAMVRENMKALRDFTIDTETDVVSIPATAKDGS